MMKKTQDQAGTTMVEAIVAFFIMVIIVGIFSYAMKLTGNMTAHSGGELAEYRRLAGWYYLDGNEDASGSEILARGDSFDLEEGQTLVFENSNKGMTFSVSDVTVRTARNGHRILKDVRKDEAPVPN